MRGIAATKVGPWTPPPGWRWIEDKLYAPAGITAWKDEAQRRAHGLRVTHPGKSVRVLREKDGLGYTYKLFLEVPSC